MLQHQRWLGNQSCQRRSVVEECSIPIFCELVHLQLEIIDDALRVLVPVLQYARGLDHARDAGFLAVLGLGEEVVLTKLGVCDAAFPVEVKVGETLGDGIVNLCEAHGEGVADVGDALVEGVVNVGETLVEGSIHLGEPLLQEVAAVGETRVQLLICFGEMVLNLILLLVEETMHLVNQELELWVHGAAATGEVCVVGVQWRRRWRRRWLTIQCQ